VLLLAASRAWTLTNDAAFYGIGLQGNVPSTIQDRAYTLPIW
jgi:hypothetical protein